MKVILVFVTTLNGKITRGNDPEVRHWSSKSDQKYFSKVWESSKLIVMGSKTWDQNIVTPAPGRLIVVMTRKPQAYKSSEIPDQLEFSSLSPAGMVEKYRYSGIDIMTVLGGPHVATSFLKESLIDEFWLTIEPKLFGKGFNLLTESDLEISLQLKEIVKANEEGTLITKYSVIR